MYYCAKQEEFSAEIADIEKYLNNVNKDLLEELCNQSMIVLKDKLARKYEGKDNRKIFGEDDLWKKPYDVLAEYPVILSTTFSSRNSLNSDVVYDLLKNHIMELYEIPLLRFKTNGSSEKEKIIEMLDKLVG